MEAATTQVIPSRQRRGVPLVIGALLATLGALIAAAAASVLITGNDDVTLQSDRGEISTPTTALVSSAATIDDTAEVEEFLGDARIQVSASSAREDHQVFVGIGPAGKVDRYLADAPLDRVTDFDVDPLTLDRVRRPGTKSPRPPALQSFWVAQSNGTDAAVDWKVRDGRYKVVVMNSDGSRRVTANARIGAELSILPVYAVGLLLAGLAVLGGGIAVAKRS